MTFFLCWLSFYFKWMESRDVITDASMRLLHVFWNANWFEWVLVTYYLLNDRLIGNIMSSTVVYEIMESFPCVLKRYYKRIAFNIFIIGVKLVWSTSYKRDTCRTCLVKPVVTSLLFKLKWRWFAFKLQQENERRFLILLAKFDSLKPNAVFFSFIWLGSWATESWNLVKNSNGFLGTVEQ